MAEQPMYAYWDDQTAVSASGAAAPSSSLPPPPHSSSRPQQNFSLDSVNYNNASTGGSAPSQGFVGGQFVAAPAAGQNNQESVRQLQQNLMLMLQQHSEQKAGDQTSQGNNTSQLSHSPQLQSQQQEDFMAQYCQLLGLQQDDGAPEPAPSNSGSTSNSIDNTASPSSSRLFALGAMVEPLPPDKPPHFKTSGKSGTKKQQEISASSLGMSESSSDFMMKLFQSDGGTQQQPSDYSGSFPFQQTSNSSITSGGGYATAALQQFQKSQQQPDQMQSFAGGFSLQQQQHQPQNLQEQLRRKQEQLQFLQQQMHHSQPQHHLQPQQSLAVEPLQSSIQDDEFGLPCTMLPPSVLASMFAVETSPNKPKAVPHKAGKSHIKARKRRYNVSLAAGDDTSDMKPQQVFCELLDRRNYDKELRFKADDSGYDAVPSPLQLASFGTQLVKAVQKSDIPLLSKLLECGLSPNPCNQFRDSVFFDLVIKRSNLPVFECLLNHGCDLQVVDGFGRTPLHHCCWASTFCRPIVEIILARDPVQIFLEDKHGQTPLEYVRANLYGEWNDFLEEVADKYWPMRGQLPHIVSPKDRRPAGHIPDPTNALSVTLASMLSSGSLSPEQVASMDENTRRSYENYGPE